LKIKFGGSSSTCESVIMSPRTESSPNESPRQEGLKLYVILFQQINVKTLSDCEVLIL
jgi:hypothetical protein